MAINLHSQLPDATLHNPKGFSFASAGTKVTRDEKSELNWQTDLSLPAALSFATATSTPPTEVDGDIYVLLGGTPHGDWDGASENDWVRFDGTSGTWKAITPTSGTTCLNIASGDYKIWNGSAWVNISSGSASNFANTDLTLTGARTHDLGGYTLTLDNGQTTIQGAGSTSATKALLVQNSSGTDHFTVFDDGNIAINQSTATFSIDANFSHAGGTTFSLKNSNSGTNNGAGLAIKNSSNDTFTLQAAAVNRSSKTFKQRAANIEGNSTISRMIFTVPNTTISNPFRFLAGGDEEHDCILSLDKDSGQIVKLDIGSENSAIAYYTQSRIQSTLTTTTAGSEDSQMIFQTSDGGSLVTNLELLENKIGFFNTTPVIQPSGTGETTGFTAGAGTGVNDDSTFTGNVGATAYRISDIVKHLKNLGLIAQ